MSIQIHGYMTVISR